MAEAPRAIRIRRRVWWSLPTRRTHPTYRRSRYLTRRRPAAPSQVQSRARPPTAPYGPPTAAYRPIAAAPPSPDGSTVRGADAR
jgi:hypothetical protein